MPRVVPSQVTALMDRVLSGLIGPPTAQQISPIFRREVSTIVDLAAELPDELLPLSGDDYSDYRVGINSLRNLLASWQRETNAAVANSLAADGAQCLGTIRDLFAKCPDESPSRATTELAFIRDDDLRDSIRNDISAANQALHDGLWKATTVLAGAAAEALLLWAIISKKTSTEVEAARQAVTPSAHEDPDRWDLAGYTKVGRQLALIDVETQKQVDIAREFRNLIHPGRSRRLAKVCDRGTALSALAAVELIVRDLSQPEEKRRRSSPNPGRR